MDDVAAQFQPVLTRHQGELLPDKLLVLGFHFGRTGRTIAVQIDLCQIVVQMVEVDVAGLALQGEVAQQVLLGQLLCITGHQDALGDLQAEFRQDELFNLVCKLCFDLCLSNHFLRLLR